MIENFKTYEEIIKIKEVLEKEGNIKIKHHGLKDLNSEGYPYFVQWNYKSPLLKITSNSSGKSTLYALPYEVGLAIEKILGNVTDEVDYQDQINKFFEIKLKR